MDLKVKLLKAALQTSAKQSELGASREAFKRLLKRRTRRVR